MAVKELVFEADARQALLAGVEKLAAAVKSTLGPRGRSAIIDKSWGGPTVTKDGVSVADEIELRDKFQNMGAKLVCEAASKTSDDAGDGQAGRGKASGRARWWREIEALAVHLPVDEQIISAFIC